VEAAVAEAAVAEAAVAEAAAVTADFQEHLEQVLGLVHSSSYAA
jgi:hypothetical protein